MVVTYTNRVFRIAKCVLFIEVSSILGVPIRRVHVYYKKKKGKIATYHTVIKWGYFDISGTSLIRDILVPSHFLVLLNFQSVVSVVLLGKRRY